MAKRLNLVKAWANEIKTFKWSEVNNNLKKGNVLEAIILAHSNVELILRLDLFYFSAAIEPSFSKRRTACLDQLTFLELSNLLFFCGLIDVRTYGKLIELNSERNKWVHTYLIKSSLDHNKATKLALQAEKLSKEFFMQFEAKLMKIFGKEICSTLELSI
ncbi:hypothetical protein HYV82_01190 [Candidatus Woesearchaeota archaeon]|nr:hypothetical protein [Candidatus Woesearchaeota archaeon]